MQHPKIKKIINRLFFNPEDDGTNFFPKHYKHVEGNKFLCPLFVCLCFIYRYLFIFSYSFRNRLCGLVVRVLGYRSGGPGSIPGTTRKKCNVSETGSIQPREYNWGATW
jgi:hypothetical protein